MEQKINISVVIPAYNEAKRLPVFLESLIFYCKKSMKTYEIIVVDDGSYDSTVEVALSFKGAFPALSVYHLERNRGKGYAIKYGFFQAQGEIVLLMDADGSTPAEEIEKNIHYLQKEGFDIFIGSRVLKDVTRTLRVKFYRKIIGTVFNFFIKKILFKEIRDTQCGFKIFKRRVIRPLFSRSYINGFGFDIEILYLAHRMGYRIKEMPVSWSHVNGSKVNLILDSLKMFINIMQVRNWHYTPVNPEDKYLGPDEYRYMFEMENRHWWFLSRNNLVLHLVRSFKYDSPRILDAGSGTGINLVALARYAEVFGIEISQEAIDFCQRRNIKRLIYGSVENIGFKDKSFDIITCLDVLEHLDIPFMAISEFKRVLKDGGKIIITVPAFKFLWSQHDEALSHRRRYTREDLELEIKNCGMKIERIGYFFFASFFAVAGIRILRRFFTRRLAVNSDTTTLPSQPINEFLKNIFKVEIIMGERLKLPFGTTLYAVVSK